MAFDVTVTILGDKYTVTWDQGEVFSDPANRPAISMLETYADLFLARGHGVGPIGLLMDPTDWSNGLAFLWLCIMSSEDEIETSGQVPEPPSVPEGAVI